MQGKRPVSVSLSDLLGSWTLERTILHGTGQQDSFRGAAVWRPDGTGALYEERGVLQTGQGRFTAERRYRWDAALAVFFEDGRFFHGVPRGGGAAEHWCDPDHYAVRYDFDSWPDWSCSWRVRGPRKDYTLHSRYCRAAA